MTEEEKQKRSDDCTAEEFARRLSVIYKEVYELYSIVSRLNDDRTIEFSDTASEELKPFTMALLIGRYGRDISNNLCPS